MRVNRITLVVTALAAILSAALPSHATSYIWTGNGSSNSWYSPGNWEGGTVPVDEPPADYVFAASGWNAAKTTIAIDGANSHPNANTLTFNENVDVPLTIQIGPGNSLLLTPLSPGATTIAVTQTGVKHTIAGTGSAFIQLGNDQQWSIDGDLEVSAIIWDDGESTNPGFIKTGVGTLTLSGNNSFSGPISIDGGVLNVSTIAATQGQACDLGRGDLTLSGGTLMYTGASGSTSRGFALGAGGSAIGVQNAATSLTFTGAVIGGQAGLTKIGSGALTLGGANSYTGLTTVTAGTLKLAAPAFAAVLSTTGTARGADIQGGQLVFDYTAGSDPVATVMANLHASFTAGSGKLQSGPMFTSTGSAVGYGIGYVDDPVAKTVTAKVAVYGDATLDGVTDISDLSVLAAHWNQSGQKWATGDFNYDGVVDISDLSLLAANWNKTLTGIASNGAMASAGLSGAIPVPEPGTLVLLGCGLFGPLAYAWRRRIGREEPSISLDG